MREIKFRGKASIDIDTSGLFNPDESSVKKDDWVYGCGFSLASFFAYVNNGYIDPTTVGQWTGLKDKNGVDIYEGDLVQYKHYVACERWWSKIEDIEVIKKEAEEQRQNFSVLSSPVRFADGCFKMNYPLTLQDVVRQQRLEKSKGSHADVESKWWDFEVIGNIHEVTK